MAKKPRGKAARMRARRRRLRIRRIKMALAACGAFLLCVMVIGTIVHLHRMGEEPAANIIAEEDREIFIGDIEITGMGREEARRLLERSYIWNMTVKQGEDSYQVEDYLKPEIEKILDSAYSANYQEHYELTIQDIDGIVSLAASQAYDALSQPASDSEIVSYDSSTGTFVISEGSAGYEIDVPKLEEELRAALKRKQYDITINAEITDSTSAVAKEDIKLIGRFTTTTTTNAARNINIQLACDAVNGTILQPGGQFSYNDVVGQRTVEKGYQSAAAYANGEHTTEIGGGVCQLSSTIYNAAIASALQIDERIAHTFEPTYVTPGEDATVSFGYPDFKFTNNSKSSIGIRTIFENYTVTAEIYGVPILEAGKKRYLESEKVGDVDPPETVYILDETLLPGEEAIDKGAVPGTKWETYIVEETDGVVTDRTYLHTSRYKGSAAVIRRNPLPGEELGDVPNDTLNDIPDANPVVETGEVLNEVINNEQ